MGEYIQSDSIDIKFKAGNTKPHHLAILLKVAIIKKRK